MSRTSYVRSTFDLASSGYDRSPLEFFRDGAVRLVEFALVRRGDDVLDVATGTEWAAVAAAAKVGPGGRVVRIDLSPRMIVRARKKARQLRLQNVVFRVENAQRIPYAADTFDKVLAAQAIFFMPKPLGALREWCRVLKPGGSIAISSWGKAAFQPMGKMLFELFERYGIHLQPESGPSFETIKECRGYLKKAGLGNIISSVVELGYALPNAETWWTIVCNTALRGNLRRLNPKDRSRFRRDHLKEIESLRGRDGIQLPMPAIFVTGRKPEA
jgi:ubiquinone/menaquinone biosynthesis C-methylase UbiE